MSEVMVSSNFLKSNSKKIAKEQKAEFQEILKILENINRDIYCINNNFDYAVDESLIDSCIFELNSLNMKHTFYTKLCKEKGYKIEGAL